MRKKILIAIISCFMIAAMAGTAMADTYSSYYALAAHKTKNVDYLIAYRNTSSSKAVIAIHGGTIEPETDKIASAAASRGGYDYYAFKGLRSGGSLHITSTNFNEPIAREMVSKSTETLSIHGCGGTRQAITYVGGLDNALGNKVKASLRAAGFKVVSAPSRLGGNSRANIVNRNKINKGVQLELSNPMRNKLGNDSKAFARYTKALTEAL